MSFKSWPFKDPDEILDYSVDWSQRLLTDTISTSTWVVPAGITKVTDTHDTTSTTIWLSGGTEGSKYTFVNRITTNGGRTYDQTITLKVKTR